MRNIVIKLWIIYSNSQQINGNQKLLLCDDVLWPVRNKPVQFLIYIDGAVFGMNEHRYLTSFSPLGVDFFCGLRDHWYDSGENYNRDTSVWLSIDCCPISQNSIDPGLFENIDQISGLRYA